ncbi:peptidoglycan editing factor PgeF [Mycoplasma sp. P36-A1]|uniref:peptidoglycan editing factor PgeF n=1 Tax=Mycoplasma sp. P36-A1 TaxID=3252900 RepID=UPI003C2BEB2E
MYYTWINDDNVLAITSNNKDGVSSLPLNNLNFGYHVNDKKEDVDANYNILANDLNIDVNNIYYLKQIHSSKIIKVNKGLLNPIDQADALYTKEPGVYISVFTADCLPILVYDYKSNIVCAIHAGYAGSAKLIAFNTINYLVKNECLNLETTKVFLGPSIMQDSYEVDDYVKNLVNASKIFDIEKLFKTKSNGKYLFDNRLYNTLQLQKAGILIDNIQYLNHDTFTYSDYFSYRENKNCGRMISLIGLKENKRNYRKYAKSIIIKDKEQQNTNILEQVNELINKNNYQNIFIYLPMSNEVDLTSLANNSKLNIYIPKIIKDGQMVAVKYDPTKVRMTKFGCLEAYNDDTIDPRELDLILVPAAAFDKKNERLGHGKGFYDRYIIKATNSAIVGISFNEFIFEKLPTDSYDVRMDSVITYK